jgi:hypothetical protein
MGRQQEQQFFVTLVEPTRLLCQIEVAQDPPLRHHRDSEQ